MNTIDDTLNCPSKQAANALWIEYPLITGSSRQVDLKTLGPGGDSGPLSESRSPEGRPRKLGGRFSKFDREFCSLGVYGFKIRRQAYHLILSTMLSVTPLCCPTTFIKPTSINVSLSLLRNDANSL